MMEESRASAMGLNCKDAIVSPPSKGVVQASVILNRALFLLLTVS